MKNNLAVTHDALTYRLEPSVADPWTPRLVWDDAPVPVTDPRMQAALKGANATPSDPEDDATARPKLHAAKAFLKQYLAAGPKPAKEVEAAASDAGVTIKTLRYAREALGLVCDRSTGPNHVSTWALPAALTATD